MTDSDDGTTTTNNNHNNEAKEETLHISDNDIKNPIVKEFDRICFNYGDEDAIVICRPDSHDESSHCYYEIQEHSKNLANQLYYRLGRPHFILVDCCGWPCAEAIATLACMRIRRPFVPVSATDLHRPGRMESVVELLLNQQQDKKSHSDRDNDNGNTEGTSDQAKSTTIRLAAVVVCRDPDRDPILSVFQQAGVHRILALDKTGMLLDCLNVPDSLPDSLFNQHDDGDDDGRGEGDGQDYMYVLFTSGTTADPNSTFGPKAVVGSHRATWRRIQWFTKSFQSSPRVGRRTKLTFVDGITELWGCLLDPDSVLVGVPPSRLQRNGIASLIHDAKCTQLLLLPSQLHQLFLLASSNNNDDLKQLDRLIVSGEVCTTVLLEKCRQNFPNVQLINLYGQTETTGDCMYAVLSDLEIQQQSQVDNVVAVGRPIGDTVIRLLVDEGKGHSSDRREGQIEIRGSQLSHGYLGKHVIFGKNEIPFTSFRTGDIGFNTNGLWYVRGRFDDVKKINGTLTSLYEVEAAFIKTYPMCINCVAVTPENGNNIVVLCEESEGVKSFSREDMVKKGIPFHLIPRTVICHPIPRNLSTGAGKIDRKACLQIVNTMLGQHDDTKEACFTENDDDVEHSFLKTVARVLNVQEKSVNAQKSFVENGGDSASSITLLYHLKEEWDDMSEELDAIHILSSDSLSEIESLLSRRQHGQPKRARVQEDNRPVVPEQAAQSQLIQAHEIASFCPIVRKSCFRAEHTSIKMQACVDGAPLLIGDYVYEACQGGTVLFYNTKSTLIEAVRIYNGWMFQADLLHVESSQSILACAHSFDGKSGLTVCLSLDLSVEKWSALFKDGPILSTPLVHNGIAWILCGDTISSIDVDSGNQTNAICVLPRQCKTTPFLVNDNPSIGYISSGWDGGIMVFDAKSGQVTICSDYEIGPVHAPCLRGSLSIVMISDMYGSIHCFDCNEMKLVSSLQLATNTLATATVLPSTITTATPTFLVGSYDGRLFCVEQRIGIDNTSGGDDGNDEVPSSSENIQLVKIWEYDCQSSIKTPPLCIDDDGNYIVVGTTSGDVIILSTTTATGEKKKDKGDGLSPPSLHRRCMIDGEIWSPPKLIPVDSIIVFGARDSHLHFLKIDGII